jgi:hypothetical protein
MGDDVRRGPPTLDEWLRRRDNGEWARVEHVARKDVYNPPTPMPLYEGDVIMQYKTGVQSICSGGEYFWSRWERVDLEDLAQTAIKDAHGHSL